MKDNDCSEIKYARPLMNHKGCSDTRYVKGPNGYVCPSCGHQYLSNNKEPATKSSELEPGIIKAEDSLDSIIEKRSLEELNFIFFDRNLVPIDDIDKIIKYKQKSKKK